MARIILIAVLIGLLNVLVGCHGVDSGQSQILTPKISPTVAIVEGAESDLVEQVAINRQAYRQYLESLVAYYESIGNNMKLTWAKDELKSLKKASKYNYIINAVTLGPNLRATASILEADYMYDEALRIEKKARKLILITHEDNLRLAMNKYNNLITRHPTWDKIDDAAFRIAGILEYFKDYTVALLYYQRTYQWDPATTLPAKYKAARLLDKHLYQRAEALEMYEQAVKQEGLSESYKQFAERRIAELSKSGEEIKESK